MAFNSNGKISYLVLDSLLDGSKYGLEIIEFISQKTGGNFIMKKPTLYSCLTRMEKKGLVSSSYWGESELGGKRHYYSITSEGKKTWEELSQEFANANFTNEEPAQKPRPITFEEFMNPKKSEPQELPEESQKDEKPVFLQQDNLFDMVKPQQPVTSIENDEDDGDVIENQIDIFSFQENLPQVEEKTEEEPAEEISTEIEEQPPVPDDGKFLDKSETLTEFQTEQNQRLYDTSLELKKYRKRKSFSENQIEMSVVYENAQDREIQKARIEQLKQSLLNVKQNNEQAFVEKEPAINTPYSKVETPVFEENEETVFENKEERKDDAVFLSEPRIETSQIPIQKKISPTNIEVSIDDNDLPAPKRDSNLEPTYKDMMAKLFERKKEKTKEVPVQPSIAETPKQIDKFADYDNLKNYYNGHGIEFKEYKKSNVERRHNTNLLKFISSTILLLLSGIGSAVLFAVLSGCQMLQANMNFMFYTLPALFCLYSILCLIRYRVEISKKATLLYNSVINWAIFILGTLVIFVINIICGMQYETMGSYLTSLLIPIIGILIAFPINYYIKKFIYKKFAK